MSSFFGPTVKREWVWKIRVWLFILNTDSVRVNVISVQVSIYNGYCFSPYPDSLLPSLLSSSIHQVIQYPDYFNNSLFNKYLLWHFSVHTWITKETLNKFHSHSHWHCCQIHRFSTQLKTMLATSCVTTNRTNTHHHAFSHARDSLILSIFSQRGVSLKALNALVSRSHSSDDGSRIFACTFSQIYFDHLLRL